MTMCGFHGVKAICRFCVVVYITVMDFEAALQIIANTSALLSLFVAVLAYGQSEEKKYTYLLSKVLKKRC